METDYKRHTIEILTDEVHSKWTFRALVFVADGSSQTVKRLSYHGRHFQTKEEAEREGLLFVKRWIDDGMPDTLTRPFFLTHKN
jgi:hypothetical protein